MSNKPTFKNEDITGREWRFGFHLPSNNPKEDFHLIKEYVHLKDGRIEPNLRVISKFQRPVYSSKLNKRGYTDKKEYEYIRNLDVHYCTQSELRNKVAMLVERAWSKEHLSELLINPFIYGGDIPSTTIIHRELYQKKNSHIARGAYRVAAFDTETDMVYGTEQIIIGTMTLLPEVHVVVRHDYLNHMDLDEVKRRFEHVMAEKLGPEIAEHKLQITLEVVDTEIDIVEKSFKWFHERKPDFMSIWNMDFDVTKILDACKRFEVEPRQILCEPTIPYQFRMARYKRGQTKKIAASGKAKPVSPYDQWHTLYLTASFYIIDAMSSYRLLRLGEQEERSYSLDAILQKELKVRKLRHEPADKYVKEKWHQVMQAEHKFEYLAYAAFDTISMALLDLKTKDLSHKLPAMADITDFYQCNSQPKRLRDAFYVFASEEHEAIIGSVGHSKEEPEESFMEGEEGEDENETGDDEEEEENHQVLDRRNWVITLASHLSAPGLKLLEDAPEVNTNIRAFVYDSDAVSSYPSCTQVGNVAKVTTRKEVCKVGDFDEDHFRRQNLGLVIGETNALEYSMKMFGAPTLFDLQQRYLNRNLQS